MRAVEFLFEGTCWRCWWIAAGNFRKGLLRLYADDIVANNIFSEWPRDWRLWCNRLQMHWNAPLLKYLSQANYFRNSKRNALNKDNEIDTMIVKA